MALSHEIGMELSKLHHHLLRAIDAKLSTLDPNITVPQARIISYIQHEVGGQAVFQRDIEKFSGLQRSSVSLMLNNMEKNGLILRKKVENDARLKQIILTEKASAIAEEIYLAMKDVEQRLSISLDEDEAKLLLKIIRKMQGSLLE